MRTSSSSTWAASPADGRPAVPPLTQLLARKAAVRGAAWATPTVRGSVMTLRAERRGETMLRTYPRRGAEWVITRGCSGRFPDVGDALDGHEGVMAVDVDPELERAHEHQLAVVDAGAVGERDVDVAAFEMGELVQPSRGH